MRYVNLPKHIHTSCGVCVGYNGWKCGVVARVLINNISDDILGHDESSTHVGTFTFLK
jgi:hypothetical protein